MDAGAVILRRIEENKAGVFSKITALGGTQIELFSWGDALSLKAMLDFVEMIIESDRLFQRLVAGCALGYGLLWLYVAIKVYRDGRKMRQKGWDTFLVGPFAWALIVLAGNVFAFALYWGVHHSSLRPAPPKDKAG